MSKDLLVLQIRKKFDELQRAYNKILSDKPKEEYAQLRENFTLLKLELLDSTALFGYVSRRWRYKNKLLFSCQVLIGELALFGCLKGIPTLEQAHKEARELVSSEKKYNIIAQDCKRLKGNFSRSYFLSLLRKAIVYDEYFSERELSHISADENDILFESALYVLIAEKYVDEELSSSFLLNLPELCDVSSQLFYILELWEARDQGLEDTS